MSSLAAFFGEPIRIDLPNEFATEASLLAYLDVSTAELKKIWFYRHRMYQHFSIAKRPDKVRLISAPDRRLKMLQRKIADKLASIYKPRRPVHGFVRERSIRSNADAHLRRRHVVNLDIKDFFPTITERRVGGLLRALGINGRVADIISRICCNNGHLPQGAPSSPVISNMICFRLDKALMTIAKEARCVYTRYADDITFSSHQPPTTLFEAALPPSGRFSPELLSPRLLTAFLFNGFTVNPEKAHYADRNSRRIVTGLKVNELLNVDRRYVRNIRAALHSVEKFGEAEADRLFREKYRGQTALGAHLQGKISFLTFIKGRSDPVVRGITLRFNRCFPSIELKVDPTAAEIRDRAVWIIDNNSTIEQGSAFFLEGIGLLTAAHCVLNTNEVDVYHPSKPANKFVARVRKISEARDLALLEHDIPATEYYELRRSKRVVARRDQLTAIGYPGYGPGDRINERIGSVSSLTTKNARELIEVTQLLTPGMSGGPLVDGDGGVVGIVHKGGPGEGRNFAINIRMLDGFLNEG